MSEEEKKIDEQPQNASVVDSTAIASDEPNKMCDEKPKDVSDESDKGFIKESNESHPVEMEAVNKEPAVDDVKKLNGEQDKATPMADTVIANHSVCVDLAPTNETIPQKPVNSSIGSLGLLNQYASSSDEDDDSSDSSSSSSSESSDTESDDDDDDGSDSNDASTNVEMLNTSNATQENQLNAVANNILKDAMSRSNYRDASSDT